MTDISEETVQLLAPLNGTTVTLDTIKFSWNGVYDATEYHVQVATPSFENAAQIVLDSVVVVDSTFVGTHITKSLSNSEYEWRVKAMNSGFDTEFSSSSFTVNASN